MYNVAYDHDGVTKFYCMEDCSNDKAKEMLEMFKARYMDGDNGKEYPNKRGFYPFRNPRVIKM